MINSQWKKIKEKTLGKRFDLSIVFTDSRLIKKLNKAYRKKDRATSVLSFPLSKTAGEIFLNLSYIKKEAKGLKLSFKNYLNYLFIHSIFHLKGYRHGKKMEREEKKIFKKFYGEEYYNRD